DKDFKPLALRPFGYQEVWVGYDPAESGDTAGLVVIAPPSINYSKFRLLERHQFKGMDFQAQAAYIKKICENYRVTYIGLDTTGMGTGVAQLVRQFFPALTTFSYSVEVKTMLVLKAMDVVHQGRFEFDAGWTDVAQSFMAIKKTMTGSGRQFTFEATRSEEVGHADLAWACMHVFANEPLEGRNVHNTAAMEIF
ncbi:MAG: terminase, partial [Acinetobacter sp.]